MFLARLETQRSVSSVESVCSVGKYDTLPELRFGIIPFHKKFSAYCCLLESASYLHEESMLSQKRVSWFKWRKMQKNGLRNKKKKATKKHSHGKKALRTQVLVKRDGDLRCPTVDTGITAERFSFRTLSTAFVSLLALIFFATLGLPSFMTNTIMRSRRCVLKYFMKKRQQAAHKKMMKQQAEFLSFIAILQAMKGGSTPGRKGFQKGKSGRVPTSSQGYYAFLH